MQYVENEFEVTARLHELCSQYEHQIEEWVFNALLPSKASLPFIHCSIQNSTSIRIGSCAWFNSVIDHWIIGHVSSINFEFLLDCWMFRDLILNPVILKCIKGIFYCHQLFFVRIKLASVYYCLVKCVVKQKGSSYLWIPCMLKRYASIYVYI